MMMNVPLIDIYALHEVRDAEKLETLTGSMREAGWTGRPLIVVEIAEWYQAITGSHRLAAAEAAGIEEIPCVIITRVELEAAALTVNDFWDDEITLNLLRQMGNVEAVAVMAQENTD